MIIIINTTPYVINQGIKAINVAKKFRKTNSCRISGNGNKINRRKKGIYLKV
jgi:hypothetical protein